MIIFYKKLSKKVLDLRMTESIVLLYSQFPWCNFNSNEYYSSFTPDRMKRKPRLLLIIGGLCLGITLLTKHIFEMPEDTNDFLVGLGSTLMISALFVQRKLESKQEL